MADKQFARGDYNKQDHLADDDPLSELARIVSFDARPATQQLEELKRHRAAFDAQPTIDLEAELLAAFDGYDAPVAVAAQPAPREERPVEAPAASPADIAAVDVFAASPADVAPVAQLTPLPAETVGVAEYDVGDLERELEQSIFTAAAAEQVLEPAPLAPPVLRSEAYVAQPEEVAPPEVVTEAIAVAPSMSMLPAAEEVAAAASERRADPLLADVERFPVPQPVRPAPQAMPREAAPAAAGTRKSAYPFVASFSRATPTVSGGSTTVTRPAEPPVVAEVAPVAEEPAAAPVSETVFEPQPDASFEALAADPVLAAEAEPEIDLEDFEIDLSHVELDLSMDDLDLTTQEMLADPAGESPSPVAYTVADYTDRRHVVEEPVESPLPFDPTMISEADESIAPVADLDIPQLPPVEKERPPAPQTDYDLDIDAEMAHLFETARARPQKIEVKASPQGGFEPTGRLAPVSHGRAEPADDFADFEKVMEEDFRRSFAEGGPDDLSVARQHLQPGYGADEDFGEGRTRRRRVLALAACVAGIALLAGGGVYAFLGGSTPGSGSSAPRVILADKDPVKVVPDERGGKTVPNQDKAVYDRVAGATEDAPRQEALLSSNEEPVDVVQRTLTPETLPLEGGEEFSSEGMAATPVDSAENARLLPDDAEDGAAAAPSQEEPAAVSPRKVKTMIVKPDGTLVAREEPAPAAGTAPVQPAVADATDEGGFADIAAAGSASVTTATTASAEAVADSSAALEQIASAEIGSEPPVRNVTTTPVAATPVPQSRPSDQPVNVVGRVTDQGTVTRTAAPEASAEAAPTEVAALQPPPAALPAGTYVVQIASLPSEAEAQRSYDNMARKFGGVIGGRGVDIRRADVAGKGTYYRVRIPAGSREEANSLCAKLKSAGGSCLVTR
ncbi:SPOR domain-containing protein [Ensifer soli]|uniref:SPOR domain-containing protein n=1 Tax=Ciceribacter sp. sgz301302 TaxID=3342379 RepID=UPI0035B92BD8